MAAVVGRRLDEEDGWTTMEDLDKRRRPIESIEAVTFGGCGFLGVYLVGAATYLQEHIPSLLEGRLGGSSVGSLVAVCIACDIPLNNIRQRLLDIARSADEKFLTTLNPSFNIDQPLLKALLDLLPVDAHERCTGKVFLSLTKPPTLSNEIVSEFKSRQELIDAVCCCCYVPMMSGFSFPSFKGHHYVDGAMSDNLPLAGPNTLTVHALSGDFDICPHDSSLTMPFMASAFNQRLVVSTANVKRLTHIIKPPPADELDKYCMEGYGDARDCLTKNFRLKVARRQSTSQAVQGKAVTPGQAEVPIVTITEYSATSTPTTTQAFEPAVSQEPKVGNQDTWSEIFSDAIQSGRSIAGRSIPAGIQERVLTATNSLIQATAGHADPTIATTTQAPEPAAVRPDPTVGNQDSWSHIFSDAIKSGVSIAERSLPAGVKEQVLSAATSILQENVIKAASQ